MTTKHLTANHIDHPQLYRPAKCDLCERCVVAIETGRCPYGGPFVKSEKE